MNIDFDNNDFEQWEGDYHLIEERDWASLVKLRKQRAEKHPSDLFTQWSYGEALIFNQEFKKALEFLTTIYNRDPYYPDVIHSILDALYGLGKTEKEFDWVENPVVLKLNDETKNLCKDFLKKKRKPISFSKSSVINLSFILIIQFLSIQFFSFLRSLISTSQNSFSLSENSKNPSVFNNSYKSLS